MPIHTRAERRGGLFDVIKRQQQSELENRNRPRTGFVDIAVEKIRVQRSTPIVTQLARTRVQNVSFQNIPIEQENRNLFARAFPLASAQQPRIAGVAQPRNTIAKQNAVSEAINRAKNNSLLRDIQNFIGGIFG